MFPYLGTGFTDFRKFPSFQSCSLQELVIDWIKAVLSVSPAFASAVRLSAKTPGLARLTGGSGTLRG
jgi:hypothetical protein